MMQMASTSIRNDLATSHRTGKRFGLPRLPGKVCAGFMLSKQFSRPLFTDRLTRRSRSLPIVRASEQVDSYRRRSRSMDELDTGAVNCQTE